MNHFLEHTSYEHLPRGRVRKLDLKLQSNTSSLTSHSLSAYLTYPLKKKNQKGKLTVSVLSRLSHSVENM